MVARSLAEIGDPRAVEPLFDSMEKSNLNYQDPFTLHWALAELYWQPGLDDEAHRKIRRVKNIRPFLMQTKDNFIF